MVKRYTDGELKSELSKMEIICDTRENVNDHITSWLDKKNIPYITRKLNTGDYSAMLGGLTMEKDVLIERKHNLDEICGNFTAERERFEREMIRAKAIGTKVFLVIENATWEDVFLGNYRSQLKPQSLAASLLSWQVKYNLTVLFCKPESTGKLIYSILYYWAREELLGGHG